MYLIDTSVWIDFFRNKHNHVVRFFMDIQEQNLPYGITGLIYQEILQGAASRQDFDCLKDTLATQRFFNPENEITTYEAAAHIYYSCRRKGVTIRSTLDCLISQICIEHNLVLVHNDADYQRIHSVIPELKLANY
jgi:hypothetical protein